VVYLDPSEFHSTWLATRPSTDAHGAGQRCGVDCARSGVKEFGEDKTIDSLIRKYGYRGTPATLEAVEANPDLANDLSAAAHLIHGSSEGRFKITWCPGHLTREEVEGVGFGYGDLNAMLARYDINKLSLVSIRLMVKRYSSSPIQAWVVGTSQPSVRDRAVFNVAKIHELPSEHLTKILKRVQFG